ncbi:MAG: trehalose-phosphatase [Chloroflexi bacterium]|nr:trehalose-phosphatase [Chloroflexota bacterium]
MLLALDFDGTLAPIVEQPHMAAIPGSTLTLLRALAEKPGWRVAIVTGRAVADVKRRVGLDGLVYCGNHGLEMEWDKEMWRARGAERARPVIQQCKEVLAPALAGLPGIVLEDKGLTISVHYRQAPLEDKQRCLRLCSEALGPFLAGRQIVVSHGKEVLEVQPNLRWDKGECLRRLAKLVFARATAPGLCVFLGDDVFDEPAFRAIREMDGLGILVGGENPSSAATFFLPSPREVEAFLARLVDIPASR